MRMGLIRDPSVALVDICLTTPLHVKYALAAIQAGKHVLIEKPLARTSARCSSHRGCRIQVESGGYVCALHAVLARMDMAERGGRVRTVWRCPLRGVPPCL